MAFNKSIIRTLVALMLVLSMLFTASSCMLIDFDIYKELFGQDSNEGDDNKPDTKPSPNPDLNPDDDPVDTEFYPGSGQGSIDNVSELQQTLLSTVLIISEFGLAAGAGSGVIYQIDKENGDAYIITNQHVVFNGNNGFSKNIKVYLYGMVLESYAISAKYVGGSTSYDIAVLKIEDSEVLKNSYAKAAVLGNSDNVHIFDTVYTVGNPEASGFSATQGIISVRSENLELEGADGNPISLRVMRVDAAINHGNSGGGLYNHLGQLIGIVCAKTQGSTVDNIGYAIPINLAKNLADNILDHCDGENNVKLNRTMLGITITAKVKGLIVDPDTGLLTEVEKVEVSEISAGSLAEGKVIVGDIVNSITVDGKTVVAREIHDIPEHMLTARVGSTVVMNVTRGDTTLNIEFTITENSVVLER